MIAVVVAAAVVLAPDVGLSPSAKPVAAAVVAAEVMAAGVAEVVAVAPRGLSIKDRAPLAAVVVAAAVLGAEVEAAPKVKPVPAAVAAGAADEGMGVAKRVGPGAGAAWVDAAGAGVDEGLIPKANPPPC